MPLTKTKQQEQLKRSESKWSKPLIEAGFTIFPNEGTAKIPAILYLWLVRFPIGKPRSLRRVVPGRAR